VKKLFFFLFFGFIASPVFAQFNADSFLKTIADKQDTVKIRLILNECWRQIYNSPVEADILGHVALDLIQKGKNREKEAEFLNYLGRIHTESGKFDSAYIFITRALRTAKEYPDSIQLAFAHGNLGQYYIRIAAYPAALEQFMQAYSVFSKIGHSRGVAYALNDMGEVYLKQKDFTTALDCFQQSANLKLKQTDQYGYIKTLINIATLYENKDMLDSAKIIFDKALEASRNYKNLFGESQSLAGIADMKLKLGDFESALDKTLQALGIVEKLGYINDQLKNYVRLGKIYLGLNDLEKAKYYIATVKSEAEKIRQVEFVMISYLLTVELAVKQGDYEAAYNALRKKEELEDRLFGSEPNNKIANLQTAFLTEQKERENAALKKELEYQQTIENYLIVIVVLVLTGVILLIFGFRAEKKAKKILMELNESKDRFFSIVGHDLKNPFFALENLAAILHEEYDELDEEERKNLVGGIRRSSSQISKLLSDLLTWVKAQKGEVKLNKAELTIESIFENITSPYEAFIHSKKIDIKTEFEPDFTVFADRFVIETILSNFLNNAIKFSFHGGEIVLGAAKNEGKTEIWVQDSGTGIEPTVRENIFDETSTVTRPGTNNEAGSGLGLKIVKELAEVHKCELRVESEPGKGSRFILIFP